MELGLYFALGTAFYFLPSWVGSEKANRKAIFLLNLLLGWTLIGWVVALVWAVSKEAAPVSVPTVAPAAAPASLPSDPQARANRLRELRDSGVITQEEFLELVSRA